MRFFRFVSLPLSPALASKDALTFALTFCRNDATSLTLTSDSSRAAVISFSVASRTLRLDYEFHDHGIAHTQERTFSSTMGALLREERAALSLRPKSAKTMV